MNAWESLSMPMAAQSFALEVAVSGAVVSGLALLAARLLRRRSAPLRYGVLFAGVLGLLAVPALVGLGQSLRGTLIAETAEEVMKIPAELLPEFLNRPLPDAPAADVEVPSVVGETAGAALVSAWAFGAVIGLAPLLRGLGKQRRVIVGQPWRANWWTGERQGSLAAK